LDWYAHVYDKCLDIFYDRPGSFFKTRGISRDKAFQLVVLLIQYKLYRTSPSQADKTNKFIKSQVKAMNRQATQDRALLDNSNSPASTARPAVRPSPSKKKNKSTNSPTGKVFSSTALRAQLIKEQEAVEDMGDAIIAKEMEEETDLFLLDKADKVVFDPASLRLKTIEEMKAGCPLGKEQVPFKEEDKAAFKQHQIKLRRCRCAYHVYKTVSRAAEGMWRPVDVETRLAENLIQEGQSSEQIL
jgi:hypothetical protein